jgi:hypothetical protein
MDSLAAGLIAILCAATAMSAVTAEPEVPVALQVLPSRSTYTLGEPVQLYMLYRNLSDNHVQFQSDLFLDKDLAITITEASGETWRFVDKYRMGITIPMRIGIEPGESHGFARWVTHSEVNDRPVPFSHVGLYRIEVASSIQLAGSRLRDTLLAPPIAISVLEPIDEAEREAAELMLLPEVAHSVQRLYAEPDVEESLRRVIELSPESAFGEHANFLLATIEMGREEWLPANEHLYSIYYKTDGIYPKDQVLSGIFTNFHWAEEPERALAVLEILIDLFPQYRASSQPLIKSYIQEFIDAPTGK